MRVKIGMVSSARIINVIAERLRFHQARNVVPDPAYGGLPAALVSSSSRPLMRWS